MNDFDPAPRLPVSRGEGWLVAGIATAFLGLIAADLAHGFSIDKLSVVFVLAFWGPMLVLHELGHALAARSVGWQVTEIVIGFGRELARFRVGNTRVRLRALPLEGYVIPGPRPVRHPRLAQAWVYFGGPLMDLLVLGACAWLLDFELQRPAQSLGRLALSCLGLTAAIGAVWTLVPYSTGGNSSDGLGMLASVLQDRESFRARLCWPFVSEARRLLLREQTDLAREKLEQGLLEHPGDPRLLGLLAVCQAARGESDQAFATLEALGPPEAREPALCAEQLGNAAWAVLCAGDAELMLEAQRALQRALELTPRDPHLAILLGRIHLERGRAEEAYGCFMGAYKQTRDADQEAQCVAYLAIACAELSETAARSPLAGHALRFARAVASHDVPPELQKRVQQATRRS